MEKSHLALNFLYDKLLLQYFLNIIFMCGGVMYILYIEENIY